MNARITPSKICGEIVAPPSKSYAHRILIAAYLSGHKVCVHNAGNSNDVLATVGALQSLGAQVQVSNGSVTILRQTLPSKATVDCNESGSTLRFLLPVAAALNVNATFTGQGRLLSRPIRELAQALNGNGAKIDASDTDAFYVSGKLSAGEFTVPANVSSQYITGLLFALPLLDGDSKITLIGETVSAGYLDITLDVLQRFGIVIERTDYGYFVKGNQRYVATDDVTVEGDYSGAAFPLSLGAICGKVTVKGLNALSLQGDAQIVRVLKKFGAKVTVRNDSVCVEKQHLNAIQLDCENIPDLVQIISVVASYAQGVTVLKNVNRLRLKESDRVQAIIEQLHAAGIRCEFDNGCLFIYGGAPIGASFCGGNDHRTVMSATVLALAAKGESTIADCQPFSKSYPEFYNDISRLGGQIHVDV